MAVELTRKSFTPYAAKKGEEYMNAKQRGHFRKILETLKSELSQEIDRTVHTMQDEATVFADPNDRASQESDMALELRNRDRERKLIKKIDETIARIDANRSEEHTSELQSHVNLVCRLLLEKKKRINKINNKPNLYNDLYSVIL